MCQRFVLIADNDMNDVLKDFNKCHNSDYGFVWCQDYCNLVDFKTNSRIDYNDTIRFVANEFIYADSFLEEAVNYLNKSGVITWTEYFSLYHDASRKMYILCWEDSG